MLIFLVLKRGYILRGILSRDQKIEGKSIFEEEFS